MSFLVFPMSWWSAVRSLRFERDRFSGSMLLGGRVCKMPTNLHGTRALGVSQEDPKGVLNYYARGGGMSWPNLSGLDLRPYAAETSIL